MKRAGYRKQIGIVHVLGALGVFFLSWFGTARVVAADQAPANQLFTYTLKPLGAPADTYDEALAVACLQGIINREAPRLYVLSASDARPKYWLEKLSVPGRWLHQRPIAPLDDLDTLVAMAGAAVKGVVIWDPEVPATVNVATTIAGVEDAIALSPEFADNYLDRW